MSGLCMDECIQGAITNGLRMREVDVITAVEDGRTGLSDLIILDRAVDLGRVHFSQDADLVTEGALRQRAGVPFPGVVYAHPLLSIQICVEHLELIAKAGRPDEFRDAVRYLPL